MVCDWSVLRRERRLYSHNNTATKISATSPPTTPPTIAPIGVLLLVPGWVVSGEVEPGLGGGGVEEESGAEPLVIYM